MTVTPAFHARVKEAFSCDESSGLAAGGSCPSPFEWLRFFVSCVLHGFPPKGSTDLQDRWQRTLPWSRSNDSRACRAPDEEDRPALRNLQPRIPSLQENQRLGCLWAAAQAPEADSSTRGKESKAGNVIQYKIT